MTGLSAKQDTVFTAADGAVRMIPPVWPLAASVAVNPFVGQTGDDLATTAARLARVAGERVFMPRAWFGERITDGTITDADLSAALSVSSLDDMDVDALKRAAREAAPAPKRIATVAQLAARTTGRDWQAIIADRIGFWAAVYFDGGQALWAAPKRGGAYNAWRQGAVNDLTPEIMGLPGFAQRVADAPQDAVEAIATIVERLGVPDAALPIYFHSLLSGLGGWAQLGRYELWQAELAGGDDRTAIELLAIRLVWEDALWTLTKDEIDADWQAAIAAYGKPITPSTDDRIDAVLQEAAERAAQRGLAGQLLRQDDAVEPDIRPALQAAFCIDVRSEVFRRALESLDPTIQTLGFAGFFGITPAHKGFASDVVEHRLPVLINPSFQSCSGGKSDAEADLAKRYLARAKRAWGRFKLAAVSSFAFVEATGPIYAFRLFRDSFALRARPVPGGPAPRLVPEPDLPDRIAAAAGVLGAMSLTENFARLIVVAGHGANVTNNPHASALHCGACGGYSGEVNARLLAGLLNEPAVREGLVDKGITVPTDTLFVAGLHDTTTDTVTLYDQDVEASGHTGDLKRARAWFEGAAGLARTERALRLPGASRDTIDGRSRQWSEVRPEWGLAGCQAFIAAPRPWTRGRDLAGRAFLHDYVWQKDEGFGVLELILTAPVVVASWISLQYYGSTVAPDTFGAGNKLLHNVVGGIGVLEGNGGVLRPGLPWQSVHDGDKLAHDPLRLSVVIAAPQQAITDILDKHDGVRALFDNRWLHLFALDEAGTMTRYAGGSGMGVRHGLTAASAIPWAGRCSTDLPARFSYVPRRPADARSRPARHRGRPARRGEMRILARVPPPLPWAVLSPARRPSSTVTLAFPPAAAGRSAPAG